MSWIECFRDDVILTRSDLLARGCTAESLAIAARSGEIVRVRRGLYALPETAHATLQAVRIGGRLTCVSALAAAGVWVEDSRFVHVHLKHSDSRSRSPRDRFVPLTLDNRDGCELHWRRLVHPLAGSAHAVGAVDAMIAAVRCQHPWSALASLDSAVRTGYLRHGEVAMVFAHLPSRLHRLRGLIDRRCESGLESIFRMLMISVGIHPELQVAIAGVGRVDFVIAGCIVVEVDGAEFHGSRTAARDYHRDLMLAARGYTVIRLNYRQVMFERELVLAAVRSAIAAHRGRQR